MVKENQLKGLETEINSLNVLKANLEELNDKAIAAIADNFKNIIDGGSEDIKKAMDDFENLTNKATEKLRKINQLTKNHLENMDNIDM